MAPDRGGYLAGLTLFRAGQTDQWVAWFAEAVPRSSLAMVGVVDDVARLLDCLLYTSLTHSVSWVRRPSGSAANQALIVTERRAGHAKTKCAQGASAWTASRRGNRHGLTLAN